MIGSALASALGPVLDTLTRLGVRHFVGGSVASSVHGIARATLDVDVVAELDARHIPALIDALREAYYLDESRVLDAVTNRRAFNLIHLATMFKVDVFVSQRRPQDASSFARSRVEAIDADLGVLRVPVASAEDMVLAKLEWFRRGGETSHRQWEDVRGLLRVGRQSLDVTYLRHWAGLAGVTALLDRAWGEADQMP